MAIGRRLRFEILRRDGHTCRYCGAKAPDVALEVDHVIPTALGGSDEPNNLVAACQDCNQGKASIQPDSPIIEDVAEDALRWSKAMAQASVLMGLEREFLNADVEHFKTSWDAYTRSVERTEHVPAVPDPVTDPLQLAWRELGWSFSVLRNHCRPVSFVDGVLTVQVQKGYLTEVRPKLSTKGFASWVAEYLGAPMIGHEVVKGFDGSVPFPPSSSKRVWYEQLPVPKDDGWEDTLNRFLTNGIPLVELERLIGVTMSKQTVLAGEKWRYFCGCAWRALTDLQESARRIIESEGA